MIDVVADGARSKARFPTSGLENAEKSDKGSLISANVAGCQLNKQVMCTTSSGPYTQLISQRGAIIWKPDTQPMIKEKYLKTKFD